MNCQEFNSKIWLAQTLVFHQLTGTWAGMDYNLWILYCLQIKLYHIYKITGIVS